MKRALLAILLVLAVAASAQARQGFPPTSFSQPLQKLQSVDLVVLPPVDVAALRVEDEKTLAEGMGGPARFAAAIPVDLDAIRDGTWETLRDGSRTWRLRVVSPGAFSLNFGFSRFRLPDGATVHFYPVTAVPEQAGGMAHSRSGLVGPAGNASADASVVAALAWDGPYESTDASPDGQFWTAIVPGDDAMIELWVPAEAAFEPELVIAQVGHDYRGFASLARSLLDPGEKQGSCNNDVICPVGDPWRNEIRSVAVYSLGGNRTCTGTLVNSHDPDHPPYFLTANHCEVSASNDQSMVVYWNFESPTCGALGGGSLAQHQSGAEWKANYSGSDFCLVRLAFAPTSAFNVYYAGWDAREATTPASAVCIHHPNCDEKAISFCNTPLTQATYLGGPAPGDGTHWRVHQWDDGTTEPGSSGSGLWNPDHRLVGQLHGGSASCTDISSDYFGRLSRSWEGGGATGSRLKTWLDPADTGVLFVDGRNWDEVGPSGACCASDGSCTLTIEAACELSQTWQGVGTSCSLNSCPAPIDTLSLGNGSGASGVEVAVPLRLHNIQEVGGIQLDIHFDPSIVSFTSASITPRATGMSIPTSMPAAGRLRVVMYFASGGSIPAGDGPVANINFRIIGAPGSGCDLTPDAVLLSDPTGQAISVRATAGSITVTGGEGQTGACCSPSGVCAITLAADCTSPNRWVGPNTSCLPDNPCQECTRVCPLRDSQWEWITVGVRPTSTQASDVFASLEPNLAIVKDDEGHVYIPGVYDDMSPVNIHNAFQLMLKTRPDTMVITGTLTVLAQDCVPIAPGRWNLIPYFTNSCDQTCVADVTIAMASIADCVTIAKDNDGRVWIPGLTPPLNTISEMKPCRGYYLFADTSCTQAQSLCYPPCTQQATKGLETAEEPVSTGHYSVDPTGLPEAVVVMGTVGMDLSAGDEVALFSDGRAVGSATYAGTTPFVISVWRGDEERGLRGFVPSGLMQARIWSRGDGRETEVPVQAETGSPAMFVFDPYARVTLGRVLSAAEPGLSSWIVQVRPNPMREQVEIRYEVSAISEVRIGIYDVAGRVVKEFSQRSPGAGEYAVLWDGMDDSGRRALSGTYFVRMTPGRVLGQQKLLLVR